MKRNGLVRALVDLAKDEGIEPVRDKIEKAVDVLEEIGEVGTGSERKAAARLLDSLKATAEELKSQPIKARRG